ncbi:MAG: hypothetical protein IJJ34_02090 [Clostridia bacterium]|nr:hypothetical protein [Clostridia bacterium]
MDDKDVLNLGYTKLARMAMSYVSNGIKQPRIDIIYKDDSVDGGLSMRSFQIDRLKDLLSSDDPQSVTAYATLDAVNALEPDEEQREKGLFVPSEGIREPLAMGIYNGEDVSENHDAKLYLYSCMPYFIGNSFGLALKVHQDKGTITAEKGPSVENAEKIWKSWMRILWGMNWKDRYGEKPDNIE